VPPLVIWTRGQEPQVVASWARIDEVGQFCRGALRILRRHPVRTESKPP
jgi:hypothetical protein